MYSPAFWWRVGTLSAATAVGLGAFGAHALKYGLKKVGDCAVIRKPFSAF